MEIKKYIGYISDGNRQFGNCFVIDKNKAVTATHVVKHQEGLAFFHCNGIKISFDKTKLRERKHITVIEFETDVFNWFDSSELRINVDFEANAPEQEWISFGYLPCRDEADFSRIGGRGFKEWSDKYPVVLCNPYIQNGSCAGMSGAPVVVEQMIVGVLQAEDINNDEIVENLYFSPIRECTNDINIACIQGNVFHNICFPKIDYSVNFDLDGYIHRKVMIHEQRNDSPASLTQLITKNTNNRVFVLVGEAGLGKTYELQNLAVALKDTVYYPLYFSLKEFDPMEKPEEQIPHLAEYINNFVPFCLILDGFDEIKNTNYRDVDFPNVISRFSDRIKQKYKDKSFYSIVISSRKNYYYSGKITNAVNVVLCDLSDIEINTELGRHHIDNAAFYNEIKAKRLNTFIANPFYLKHIIKLYKADEGTLPAASSLMDSIIIHLFKDKNYEKYRGQNFRLTEENTKGRKLLQKISACFIIQGKMALSQDDIIQLTDGYMEEKDLLLSESTSVFDKSDNDAWEFVHNNFCEYLAAEFFDQKYKDDLYGLLDIIAYENKSGIYNNYINMVAFLLQIRKQPDLQNWMIAQCPNTYYNIEQHQITEESALTILESVNCISNEKGYYILHDFDMPIEKIINNQSCIIYLLKILEDSNDERELLNAVRLIRELRDLCSCDLLVKNALISLLSSGKINHHHIRDTIMTLVDLELCDDDVTDYLYRQYANSHDKEILRGINRYILKNDKADLFIDALIFQLTNNDYFEYIGSYHYYCLKNLKDEDSFIKLFSALTSSQKTDMETIRDSSFKEILLSYNSSLIKLWNTNHSDALLNVVLKFTVYLVSHYIVQNNVFSDYLNSIGKDSDAIIYYYEALKDNDVLFVYLASELNYYLSFLLQGYSDGLFLEQNNNLFDYCVRGFVPDSVERKKCLSLIYEKGYKDVSDSIRYITCNDDYREREKNKKKQETEYVFDFSKLADDIQCIVSEAGLENPRCRDLFDYVYHHFSYNTYRFSTFEFARETFYRDNTIDENIEYFTNNRTEWRITAFKKFCSFHKDYADYISEKRIENVLKLTEKNLAETDYNKCNAHLLRCEIALIVDFNYDLPKPMLLSLMKLNMWYFDYQCKKGFPDYLTEKLDHETIICQIENYIDANELNSDLCDACILYCDSVSYVSDKTIQLAVRVLSDEFSKDNHYYAWNYLIKNQKADLLVSMIINNKIDKGFSAFQIHTLKDYYDVDLARYVSELFDELNNVYQSEINDDNIAELSEQYRFVIRNDYLTDKVDKLQKNLLECLKCLFRYLVHNNIDKYTDYYLDCMLDSKTYCYLEYDRHDTLFNEINSKEHIDKILTVMSLFFKGEFTCTHKISSLYTDIRTAILNIGHKYPDETLAILSEYPVQDNPDLCRAVSLLYDDLFKDKYEKSIKPYSFAETKEIVFN